MEKDTKIVIGAISILIIMIFVFNTGISGKLTWKPWKYRPAEPKCTSDSDGGIKEYIEGSVTFESQDPKEDYCQAYVYDYVQRRWIGFHNTNDCEIKKSAAGGHIVRCYVNEYSCENEVSKEKRIECPTGKCYHGACACKTDADCDDVNYACKDGRCVKVSIPPTGECTDSDGGENIYVAGDARGSDGSSTFDACTFLSNPKGILREAICKGNIATHVELTCPSETPYCNRARCSTFPPKCTDTDGGNNPFVEGTITEPRLKDGPTHTDYCENILTKQPLESCQGESCGIREYYCQDPYVTTAYQDINCPKGCENGACIVVPEEEPKPKLECRDTDGLNLGVRGICYDDVYPNGISDRCDTTPGSENYVEDFYCYTEESGYIHCVGHSYECPDGYECARGACVPKLQEAFRCTDSDGGKDYTEKGTVIIKKSGTTEIHVDHCKTERGDAGKKAVEGPILVEYYCMGDTSYIEEYLCPAGCLNGECKPSANECVDAGGKCTSAIRGCGHYLAAPYSCGDTVGVICCAEIPYCGDGVCFTHDTPGYGETIENCPEDCS